MRFGIQSRLTAWYAGAVLVALAVCGVGLYLLILRIERTRLDDDLSRAASAVAFGMAAEEQEGLDLPAAAVDTVNELRLTGIAVGIYDVNGRSLAARWEDFEPSEARAQLPREGFDVIRTSHGAWRRLVTRQRYRDASYFVMNAATRNTVDSTAGLVGSALLAIVPLTVLLAAGGGWWLARSALRPISRLASEASHASGDQPAFRLSVPQSDDELSALARAFNSLLRRLQGAIQSQKQFMADASHELRTPVSVIRSAADVTLSRLDRSVEDYRDSMQVVAEQATRLSALVDDLFLLARADAGGRPLARTRFYLDDVLSQCARAAGVLASARQIRVEVSSAEDVEVDADEDLVRRMLMNLMDNAVRYSTAGNSVRVSLTRRGDCVEVSVCDGGHGVPTADRERIFERFVRLEPARTGGAGLGLPIARWIAETHGGALTLEQSSSDGSTFLVRLPA